MQYAPGHDFILLEDLIRKHIQVLFPGMQLKTQYGLRVTRNHDYDLHENEVMDLLKSVESENEADRPEPDSGTP